MRPADTSSSSVSLNPTTTQSMSQYRWVIVALLFVATTVNYLDRQVISLLKPLLAEEFKWTESGFGKGS